MPAPPPRSLRRLAAASAAVRCAWPPHGGGPPRGGFRVQRRVHLAACLGGAGGSGAGGGPHRLLQLVALGAHSLQLQLEAGQVRFLLRGARRGQISLEQALAGWQADRRLWVLRVWAGARTMTPRPAAGMPACTACPAHQGHRLPGGCSPCAGRAAAPPLEPGLSWQRPEKGGPGGGGKSDRM